MANLDDQKAALLGAVKDLTKRVAAHVRGAPAPEQLGSAGKTWQLANPPYQPSPEFMPRRHYILVDKQSPDVEQIINRDRPQIEQWPEFQAVAVLLQTAAYSRWISAQGGNAGASVDRYRAAMLTAIRYSEKHPQAEWDESRFMAEFEAIHRALAAPHYEIRLVCPLDGFTSDSARIRLSDKLAIERLDEEHIIELVNFGLGHMLRMGAHPSTHVDWTPTHAAILEYETNPEAPLEPAKQEEIWILLAKLHAFRAGKVNYAGAFARWNSPFYTAASGWHGDDGFPGFLTYRLDGENVEAFQHFSADVDRHLAPRTSKAERRRIELCLSRLSAASSRESDSDRLLDCCNVAELLFSDGPGSIAFKVSMRLAVALHGNGWDGKEVLEVVQDAYEYRNKLAHGGGEDPQGEQVRKLEDLLRATLRQSVKVPTNPVIELRKRVDALIHERLFP